MEEVALLIVFGPKELPSDDETVALAVRNAMKLRDHARVLDAVEWFDTPEAENSLTQIEELGGPKPDEVDEYWIGEVLNLHPQAIVEQLLALWNKGVDSSGCCSWRSLPSDPNKVVFVAGTSTLGSAPMSEGFEVLKQASKLGMFKTFGIE